MTGGSVLNQSHKGGAHGYLLSNSNPCEMLALVRSQVEEMKRPRLYSCLTSRDDSSPIDST